MKLESRYLANVLLKHHRYVLKEVPSPGDEDWKITYGDLCSRAGLGYLTQSCGPFLLEVAEWCRNNSHPPINALAVNSKSRIPGNGYELAPECSLITWAQTEFPNCIAHRAYPHSI